MSRRRDVHVIGHRVRRWKVTQGGRTLSKHRRQKTAVTAARRVGRRDAVELVTHGRNGRIRRKDSCGSERGAREMAN